MTSTKLDAAVIGQKLRILRGDRLPQEVADAVGVSKMAISAYENGDRVPKDEIKVKLAQYFDDTVENIFFVFVSV